MINSHRGVSVLDIKWLTLTEVYLYWTLREYDTVARADNYYSHRSLPGGNPLSGDLRVIFETMSNNTHKLTSCGSTQDVESLNGIYASKAPNRICYSALKTELPQLSLRKNIGYHYISDFHVETGMSLKQNNQRTLRKSLQRKETTANI